MAISSEQLSSDRIITRVNRLSETNDGYLSDLAELQRTIQPSVAAYQANPGSETTSGLAGILMRGTDLKREIRTNYAEASQLASEYMQRGYSKAGTGATLYYAVVPGDTVNGLAQRFYVNSSDIIADNGLTAPYVLAVGKSLTIRSNPVSIVGIRMEGQATSAESTFDSMGATVQATIQQVNSQIEAGTVRPVFGPLPPLQIPIQQPEFSFSMPGYSGTIIEITGSEEVVRVSFLMQPVADSETRQNRFQPIQTTAGSFIYHLGPMPFTLALQGYLVETEEQLERHAFIEIWKTYIEDQRDPNGRFVNNYSVAVHHQGRRYVGVCNAITINGSGQQPFLRQYSFQFLVIEDDLYYDSTVTPNTSARQRKLPKTESGAFNNPDITKLSPGTIKFLAPVSRDP